MSCYKNQEGYPDPTAGEAIRRAQRSTTGRQNRAAGGHFEAIIEASLRWYEERGFAVVEKTPEPTQTAQQPGTVRCMLHQVSTARLSGHPQRRPFRRV